MITVTQGTRVPESELDGLLARYGRAKYNVDTELLTSDIARLTGLMGGDRLIPPNRRKSLENTIEYLKVVRQQMGSGVLRMNMSLSSTNKGVRAVGSPINLQKAVEFKVQATDYIVLQHDTMVELNFAEALNLIAFELCSEDSGYTWEEKERLLKGYGIIQVHEAKGLDFIQPDEFRRDMSLRVGESPYLVGPQMMGDYFGTEVGNIRTYREALMCSGYNLGTIVLYNLLYNLSRARFTEVKVAAQYEDSLMLVVESYKLEKLKEIASEHLAVTMQGRKFEVAPQVLY